MSGGKHFHCIGGNSLRQRESLRHTCARMALREIPVRKKEVVIHGNQNCGIS